MPTNAKNVNQRSRALSFSLAPAPEYHPEYISMRTRTLFSSTPTTRHRALVENFETRAMRDLRAGTAKPTKSPTHRRQKSAPQQYQMQCGAHHSEKRGERHGRRKEDSPLTLKRTDDDEMRTAVFPTLADAVDVRRGDQLRCPIPLPKRASQVSLVEQVSSSFLSAFSQPCPLRACPAEKRS